MTTTPTSSPSNKPIVIWLLVVAALVFAMVVVGGVTRLTRSGLSIVEWNPVMGAVPPLTTEQWHDEFAKYQQTPEYQKVNTGMTLDGFKEIFYVEWAHRLLGRLIGFAVLIPLVYFLIRKRIARELVPKVIIMLVLGGLQGALGWFMVASGLVDIPRVSAYRLTAHLLMAVAIYMYILWVAFNLLWPKPSAPTAPPLRRMGLVVTVLVCVMIAAGGFVAGNKAGFVFNTFPLMAGHFVPPGYWSMHPWWINWFENSGAVQFNHRLLAYALFAVGVAYVWLAKRHGLAGNASRAVGGFFVALLAQLALGITALLMHVPVWLGAAHQGGALVVLTFALYLNHAMRRE